MHVAGMNWGGIGFCIAMLGFVTLAIWSSPRIQRWAETPEPRSNAIDSTNYLPPFHSVHVIDFDRSKIMVQSDGSVIAQCSVQGCEIVTLLGRNVAQAIVVSDEAKG